MRTIKDSDIVFKPFESIFPEKFKKDLTPKIILNILKDFVNVLNKKDRQLTKEWKHQFFMKYHRNTWKNRYFRDGELAFYIFEYLFADSPLICKNWFKEHMTIVGANINTFIIRQDFKNSVCKASFINYFINYTVEDLEQDIN